MNSLRTNKKIAVVLLSTIVFFGIGVYPHQAHALIPGLGGTIVLTNIDESITQKALNPLAYTVAKTALHSLSKSVINWINSGFNGSPAFVQDLNQTLLDVGDSQAQVFIDQFIRSGDLSSVPWKDEIAQGVLSNYMRNSSKDGFVLNNPYTLDRVSEDPEAFVRGDYSKGGLDAWMSLVLNPGNNPLALFQNTENELTNRVAGAKGKKITELNWSQGYSSYRGICNNQGSALGGSRTIGGTTVLSFTGNSGTASNSKSPISLNSANRECDDQQILTPGALIAHAATKHLVDAGVDEYISADSIGEVVASLMGQLVGTVLGGNGLLGVSAPSAGGGRSYIDRATSPSTQLSASNSLSLSNSFLTTVGEQLGIATEYKNAWSNLATTATTARTALGNTSCPLVDSTITQAGSAVSSANEAITSYNTIISTLTERVSSDTSGQQTAVSDATTAFSTLQTSGTLPSSNDVLYALAESAPRQADPQKGIPASLYTKLQTIISTKSCVQ